MNEIGFQRTGEWSIAADEFEQRYERVSGQELRGEASGNVQGEAEQAVLDQVEEQLKALVAGLGPGQVALIESEPGKDYPKTREKQTVLVVEGENRLHFDWTVDPPLRVGIYAEKT